MRTITVKWVMIVLVACSLIASATYFSGRSTQGNEKPLASMIGSNSAWMKRKVATIHRRPPLI